MSLVVSRGIGTKHKFSPFTGTIDRKYIPIKFVACLEAAIRTIECVYYSGIARLNDVSRSLIFFIKLKIRAKIHFAGYGQQKYF